MPKDVFGNERQPLTCYLCGGKGAHATRIDEFNDFFTVCTDCDHGKTFYVAEEGFHFKVTDQFIINIEPSTWFVKDADGWLHNLQSHNQGVKFSAPLKTVEHLVTRIQANGE